MNIMSGTNEEYKRKIDLLVAYNELYEENTKLKNQLQSYKAKEDRLRHYVHTLFFENHFEKEEQFKKCQKDILQILNEGDK